MTRRWPAGSDGSRRGLDTKKQRCIVLKLSSPQPRAPQFARCFRKNPSHSVAKLAICQQLQRQTALFYSGGAPISWRFVLVINRTFEKDRRNDVIARRTPLGEYIGDATSERNFGQEQLRGTE